MATFSFAVRVGRRLNDWKTKPMLRSRLRGGSAIVRQHLTVEANCASRRAEQPTQHGEECCLARSRRAEQEYDLSGIQCDRDAVDRMNRGSTLAKGPRQSLADQDAHALNTS